MVSGQSVLSPASGFGELHHLPRRKTEVGGACRNVDIDADLAELDATPPCAWRASSRRQTA